jgi:hypothetical protein
MRMRNLWEFSLWKKKSKTWNLINFLHFLKSIHLQEIGVLPSNKSMSYEVLFLISDDIWHLKLLMRFQDKHGFGQIYNVDFKRKNLN